MAVLSSGGVAVLALPSTPTIALTGSDVEPLIGSWSPDKHLNDLWTNRLEY